MNKKKLGELSTSKVLSRFLELNKEVAIPFGDSLRYDLVVIEGTNAVRIQCKTGYGTKDVLHFKTCNHNPFTKKIRGYKDEAEYFAVYYPLNGKVYLVPINKVPKYEGNLRLTPAKNSQAKGVLWATDFEL